MQNKLSPSPSPQFPGFFSGGMASKTGPNKKLVSRQTFIHSVLVVMVIVVIMVVVVVVVVVVFFDKRMRLSFDVECV